MRTFLIMFIAAFLAVATTVPAIASVNDDQVTSQKIREADGTSGQNTNSGSGVKEGHIQNGAVTTSKIAVSAVTTTHIANGAVTDAKISGQISASKISSTGLNADTVDGQHASAFAPASHVHSMASVSGLLVSLAGKSDVTHNHDMLYQQKYGKVAVVALTGGDYMDPIAAMNDIAIWCGSPSQNNPCLLKLMPGVYNIGTKLLSLPGHVDLEGSGESTTKIIGNGADRLSAFVGMIDISNGEIRFITIENAGGDGLLCLALSHGKGKIKITNTTVIASGSGGEVYGISLRSVPSWDSGDTLEILNSTVSASGGVGWNYSLLSQAYDVPNVTVRNSTMKGNIYSYGYVKLMNVITSGLSSAAQNGVPNCAVPKCIDVYDLNWDPITCQ